MSLQELGERIKRTLAPSSSRTPEKQEEAASTSRQDRAGSIAQMQSDVSRIQHEIADLSANSANSSSAVDKATTDQQVDALQHELEQAQQSLAKLQGRV